MPTAPIVKPFTFLPPSKVGPPSPLLADNIDPETRDFRSLTVGADPVDDQVQVTVMTTKASGAAVMDVGIKFTRDKLTEDAPRVLTGDVRQALIRMIRARDIQLVGVEVGEPDSFGRSSGEANESAQSIQLNVNYRNLRAFDRRTRRIPLQPGAVA